MYALLLQQTAGILYYLGAAKQSTFSPTWHVAPNLDLYGYNTNYNKLLVYMYILYVYIHSHTHSFRERTTNRLSRGGRVRRFAICSAGPINQNKHAEPNHYGYTCTHTHAHVCYFSLYIYIYIKERRWT